MSTVTSAPGASVASDTYSVTIAMDEETVTGLGSGGFSLYGFKAVTSSRTDGKPVVWFASTDFSQSTVVSWQVSYSAYTSSSTVKDAEEIVASFTTSIELGQTLLVNLPGGEGSVEDSGQAHAVTITNTTGDPYTCGVAAPVQPGAPATPLCAFPLYGEDTDVFLPIEKVVLMFASNPVDTGVVVEQAFGQTIVIDLTEAASRDVTYDINKGWTWDGGAWAQTLNDGVSLLPYLTEPAS